MDYARAQAGQLGGQNSATAYSGQISGAVNTPKQPTISGAVGRIEGLNGRLEQIIKQLSGISDAVGGPRPASEQVGRAAASGIVYRLNDGADYAHTQVSEIDELLASITRALG